MRTAFLTTDDVQLVLIPDNDLDRSLINKLLDSGPVSIERITQSVGLLGSSVQDGIIIKRKNTSDDPSKA